MVQLPIRHRTRLTGAVKLLPGFLRPRAMVQVETTSYRGAPPYPGSPLSAKEYDELHNKLGEPTLHWRRATNADVEQWPTCFGTPPAVVPDWAVPTGSDTLDAAADIMSKLTNEQRLHVFDKFCLYCGTSDLPCYCHRDE